MLGWIGSHPCNAVVRLTASYAPLALDKTRHMSEFERLDSATAFEAMQVKDFATGFLLGLVDVRLRL